MSDEAHLLFEPEDEPNILSQSTPSDYTSPAIPRNDGRGVHHRVELEKAIGRAELKLAAIKEDLSSIVPTCEFCGKACDGEICTCGANCELHGEPEGGA